MRTGRDRLKKVKLLIPGHRDSKNWSWIKNSRLTLKPLIFPPHHPLSRLCVSEVPFAYGDLVGCGQQSCGSQSGRLNGWRQGDHLGDADLRLLGAQVRLLCGRRFYLESLLGPQGVCF